MNKSYDFVVLYESDYPDNNRNSILVSEIEAAFQEINQVFIADVYKNMTANGQSQNVQVNKQPIVFLSDKKLEETYGKDDTKTIVKKLEDLSKSDDASDEMKCTLRKIIDLLHSAYENEWNDLDTTDIRRKIEDEIDKNGLQPEEKAKIRDILGKWKYTMTISGHYLPERHQIVLYIDVINEAAKKNGLDFFAEIKMTLAHEYLHAMHRLLTDIDFGWSQSGISKKKMTDIEEALADYFSMYYLEKESSCGKTGKYEIQDRVNQWIAMYYTEWPYVKALTILKRSDKYYQNNSSYSNLRGDEFERGFDLWFEVFSMCCSGELKQAYKLAFGF